MNQLKDLYSRYKELINYLIMGVLTTVVSLASYYLCVFYGSGSERCRSAADCEYNILDIIGHICISDKSALCFLKATIKI